MKIAYKHILLALSLLGCALPTFAENSVPEATIAACKNYANTTSPFMLSLHSGDPIIATINECAKAANLAAATVSGLGLLKNPEFSYLDLKTKKFTKKTFSGVYELVVLYVWHA